MLSIFKSAFLGSKKSNNEVIWVDHHPWSKNTIDEVNPFVELILDNSGIKCASELMYERFLFDNGYAKHLANLAHYRFFYQRSVSYSVTRNYKILFKF